MRRGGELSSPSLPIPPRPPAGAPTVPTGHAARLFPYLWEYKWRVIAALLFMVGAKVANVGVPVLLKNLVDTMTPSPAMAQALLVVPIGLLLAYGLLRCRRRCSPSCAS
jgi:ABC-type multidrug transport system fused ATPase/permease subunit